MLNTLKALITDEDVFDKEDMSILDRMLEFLKSDDVAHLTAAIVLKGNVERIVRSCCFINRSSVKSCYRKLVAIYLGQRKPTWVPHRLL